MLVGIFACEIFFFFLHSLLFFFLRFGRQTILVVSYLSLSVFLICRERSFLYSHPRLFSSYFVVSKEEITERFQLPHERAKNILCYHLITLSSLDNSSARMIIKSSELSILLENYFNSILFDNHMHQQNTVQVNNLLNFL